MVKLRATEIKPGMALLVDGDLFLVLKHDHVTPGKGQAVHHFQLRNLRTGTQKIVRMGTGETAEIAYLERRRCQYLYKDSTGYVFMDEETYDQFPLSEELVGPLMGFVAENASVDVTMHEGRPVSVDLPASVVLEVVEAEEAVKGNTATNVTKLAKLETGLEVRVPLHIKPGERIKVSTSDGSFLGRAGD